MISFRKQKTIEPTFVLAVAGDYGRVESALGQTIEQLEKMARKNACRVVAALEDRGWRTTPLVQTLQARFPGEQLTVICGEFADQPARLFSAAAEHVRSDFLQFLWPGCLPLAGEVQRACAAMEERGLDWLAFAGEWAERLPEICSQEDSWNPFHSYYLACGHFLPLCQAVIRRTSFDELGGFDPSPLLQRAFDADFWLRSIRCGRRGRICEGRLAEVRWTWEEFPFNRDFRVPRYLAHSYRVRMAGRPADADRRETTAKFDADLPATLRRTVARLEAGPARGLQDEPRPKLGYADAPRSPPSAMKLSAARAHPQARGRPARIAVTGGPWEFAHNQLCFYNHFQELEGRGLFTHVPMLDHLIVPERDLLDVDMVIISRGRHANLRRVLDYCRRQSIPAVYMIDDNWFSVGSDWPEAYASVFAPGLPQFEMFLCCLRECGAVLVYNDHLAEDVRRYAQRVIQLPTNVRQADFAAPLRHAGLKHQIESLVRWRHETGGLIAGYIGSLRYSDGAFKALANDDMLRWRPVKIVLFGVVSEQQRQLFGPRAVVLPYVSYDHYAAAVGALAPDILVAPLDDSRTSRSKCPNKYLEYSMAGAAGIYSNVPLYARVIAHGRTGLLVEADTEAAWREAIVRLVEDEPLRRSIASAARDDVLARFETRVVAPLFADALLSLMRNRAARVGADVLEGAA